MEYRVCLPDHDWVIAERHKLIPSVYAGIVTAPKTIGQSKAVGYSGPTFMRFAYFCWQGGGGSLMNIQWILSNSITRLLTSAPKWKNHELVGVKVEEHVGQ
ncbi:hypothetical protein AVEN_98511-1 [Araneus ventricosus]|uniref:Uncharacterized protein n=1 Tax=Araneus ventricosus TaxID=182803 RepID=A0A4Y2ETR5_ARAVE|nr:hypothetical protein AVEN_98511-1 [Araneus ventricosus]